MCKAAQELQDIWEPDDGDFYYDLQGLNSIGVWTNWGCSNRNDRHWLPRQDQLQELLFKTCTIGYLIHGLNDFAYPEQSCPDAVQPCPACDKCREVGVERRKTCDSMEQWWLLFVMHEIYKKKWDGIEIKWIEEGTGWD